MKVKKTNNIFSYEDIENFTLELRKKILSKYNLNESQNDELLIQTVNEYRGKIEKDSKYRYIFSEEGNNSLIVKGNKTFKIQLTFDSVPFRDNFTIAHELGHYFLHTEFSSEGEEQVIFRRFGSTPSEWQANRFAAAFLMPKNLIKQKKSELKDNTILANYFKVSVIAVDTRLSYI